MAACDCDVSHLIPNDSGLTERKVKVKKDGKNKRGVVRGDAMMPCIRKRVEGMPWQLNKAGNIPTPQSMAALQSSHDVCSALGHTATVPEAVVLSAIVNCPRTHARCVGGNVWSRGSCYRERRPLCQG